MKIRVTMTLDVDPEAWAREYGIELSEVRADVQQHVVNGVRDHLGGLGLLADRD